MRANSAMLKRWAILADRAERAEASEALKTLSQGATVRMGDATVLKELAVPDCPISPNDDPTGYEAFTNKIHVADFVVEHTTDDDVLIQGVKYAELLSQRFRGQMPARVVLSHDPDSREVTVRFFLRRSGQPWGADDPNDYRTEEVMQWDC